MNEIADKLLFPATPQEMYKLLLLEDALKRARCFTHVGLNGYLIASTERLRMDQMLYGFSAIDMTTGKRVDPGKMQPLRCK